MGVRIQVRHFLTSEGWARFPRLFAEHQRCVAQFPGFLSLRQCPSPGEHQIQVTLEFQNETLLKQWRSSPEHEKIAAAYRQGWTREPEVIIAKHEPSQEESRTGTTLL